MKILEKFIELYEEMPPEIQVFTLLALGLMLPVLYFVIAAVVELGIAAAVLCGPN